MIARPRRILFVMACTSLVWSAIAGMDPQPSRGVAPIPTLRIDLGTPLPSVDLGTPLPNVDLGTPLPSVDLGTPLPSVDLGTPLPSVDLGTPLPSVDLGTPLPSVTAPTVSTSPVPVRPTMASDPVLGERSDEPPDRPSLTRPVRLDERDEGRRLILTTLPGGPGPDDGRRMMELSSGVVAGGSDADWVVPALVAGVPFFLVAVLIAAELLGGAVVLHSARRLFERVVPRPAAHREGAHTRRARRA